MSKVERQVPATVKISSITHNNIDHTVKVHEVPAQNIESVAHRFQRPYIANCLEARYS